MVIKILESPASFNGVSYNTTKMDNGKGELMKAVNFGLLRGFTTIRKEDYKHFLKMLSSLNKTTKKPQFHVVASEKARIADKYELTAFAEKWLREMGYADQPYLLVFHKDTENNHLHMVSSRINYNGEKIWDGFEYLRAMQAMNRILATDSKYMIEKAKAYNFSTVAQFMLLLENQGFIFKDNQVSRSGKHVTEFKESDLRFSEPDKARAQQLRAIFEKYIGADLESVLREKFGVELVFHSKNGQPAYGYTVIDHAQKNVFKGSEILRLNELLTGETKTTHFSEPKFPTQSPEKAAGDQIRINISNDVDDEAIHRRRRKKKARTNLR